MNPPSSVSPYPQNNNDTDGTFIDNPKPRHPPGMKQKDIQNPGEIKPSGRVKDRGEIRRLPVKKLPW